jgi:hypothetical protein
MDIVRRKEIQLQICDNIFSICLQDVSYLFNSISNEIPKHTSTFIFAFNALKKLHIQKKYISRKEKKFELLSLEVRLNYLAPDGKNLCFYVSCKSSLFLNVDILLDV